MKAVAGILLCFAIFATLLTLLTLAKMSDSSVDANGSPTSKIVPGR